jgi:WD repeat-containing protein 48
VVNFPALFFSLSNIGVHAKILELQWPTSDIAPKMSAFETHARKLRYQALGSACRDSQIEALLLGHHQDDSVETTLLRLCSRASRAGLTGISPVARIPECHGIYGVSGSGSQAVLKAKGQSKPPRIRIDQESRYAHVSWPPANRQRFGSSDIRISTGGVLICRPLLSFPKKRLLETCKSNNIPYVTDPTNFDLTLTPRNAIRNLLSSHKLPRALQAPSILDLVRRNLDFLEESLFLSKVLMEQCKILEFNGRSGFMIVQFPMVHDRSVILSEIIRDSNVQALTLRHITELLSPFEDRFPVSSLAPFIERVFVYNTHDTLTGEPSRLKRRAFTVGGVMFRPVKMIPPCSSTQVAGRFEQGRRWNPEGFSQNQSPEATTTWFLSRQPFMRHTLPTIRFDVLAPDNEAESTYTRWVLWDNRYWFRIRVTPERGSEKIANTQDTAQTPTESTPTRQTISFFIRPLRPSDLQKIYHSLLLHHQTQQQATKDKAATTPLSAAPRWEAQDGNWTISLASPEMLRRFLSYQAPDATRFTLPLLTVLPEQNGEDGSLDHDQILALPSVSIRIAGRGKGVTFQYGLRLWRVEWEWMYKNIDTGHLRRMGWLGDEDKFQR